ncbi:hypothetical protein BDN72DRAFT_859416 [Pluteus cervinus]|uniref:Uncharacterized protein n=1 Tax=Pluteus cervinus TaxID=181527 RepID=A0ACD3AMW2_9AGAR|nr:hypothetical protein BDN72DRAFT_859416 [Pluteus cervinus]
MSANLRHYGIRPIYTAAGALTSTKVEYLWEEKGAAVRGVNRCGVHEDGHHLSTRQPGGLHPLYMGFRALEPSTSPHPVQRAEYRTDVIERELASARADLMDAAAVLDRIDGGVTLLMRCPGCVLPDGATVKDITLDTYTTRLALKTGGREFQRAAVKLCQKFGEDIVLPHLRDFAQRCNIEGLPIPRASEGHGFEINPEGPNIFPIPVHEASTLVRCRLHPHGTLPMELAAHSLPPLNPYIALEGPGPSAPTSLFDTVSPPEPQAMSAQAPMVHGQPFNQYNFAPGSQFHMNPDSNHTYGRGRQPHRTQDADLESDATETPLRRRRAGSRGSRVRPEPQAAETAMKPSSRDYKLCFAFMFVLGGFLALTAVFFF